MLFNKITFGIHVEQDQMFSAGDVFQSQRNLPAENPDKFIVIDETEFNRISIMENYDLNEF